MFSLCAWIWLVKRIINITAEKSPESSQELLPPSVGSGVGGAFYNRQFESSGLTQAHFKVL